MFLCQLDRREEFIFLVGHLPSVVVVTAGSIVGADACRDAGAHMPSNCGTAANQKSNFVI